MAIERLSQKQVLTRANISTQSATQAAVAQAGFGQAVQKISNSYIQQSTRATQAAEYSKAIADSTTEFERLYAERLQERLDDDGNPTFDKLVDDSKVIGADVRDNIIANIADSKVRDRFNNSFTSYMAQKEVSSIQDARNQQLGFIESNLNSNIDNLASKASTANENEIEYYQNEIGSIIEAGVSTGAITPQRGEVLVNQARSKIYKTKWRFLMDEDPETVVDIANNSPDTMGLLADEVLQIKREAESKLLQKDKEAKAYANAVHKKTKKELDLFEEQVQFGADIDESIIDNLQELVRGTDLEETFQRIDAQRVFMKDYSMETKGTRDSIIRTLEVFSKDNPSFEEIAFIKGLKNANDRLNNEMNNDPYSLAITQGLVPDPNLIDATLSASEQWEQRTEDVTAAEEMYGQTIAPITKVEADGIREFFDSAKSPTQKAEYLGELMTGFGEHFIDVMQKVSNDGAPELAFIGMMAKNVSQGIATRAFQGQEILKTNIKILPKNNDLFIEANSSNLLPNYESINQTDVRFTVAKQIYAQLSKESSDLSGDIDNSRWASAVSMVTNGGAIQYNRETVEPPVFGMSAHKFRDWVRSIDLEDINSMGGIVIPGDEFNEIDIAKAFRNAKLVSVGEGQYHVYGRITTDDMAFDRFDEYAPFLSRDALSDTGQGQLFVLDYGVSKDIRPDREQFTTVESVRQRNQDAVNDWFERNFGNIGDTFKNAKQRNELRKKIITQLSKEIEIQEAANKATGKTRLQRRREENLSIVDQQELDELQP